MALAMSGLVASIFYIAGGTTIVILALSAWRRAMRLSERVREVREEMDRDPRPPLAALAALLEEQNPRNKGQ